jgi:hypothetical protein
MTLGPQRSTMIEKLNDLAGGRFSQILGGKYLDDVDGTVRHLLYGFSAVGTLHEGQMSIMMIWERLSAHRPTITTTISLGNRHGDHRRPLLGCPSVCGFGKGE